MSEPTPSTANGTTRVERPGRVQPTRWVSDGTHDHFTNVLARLRESREREAPLVRERTIGEGGMGLVWLATQRALGRKVAVKTLRPELRDPRAVDSLLQEAWITGALEHPNVVPVHDVGCDDDGAPYIVLKRIEGLRWSELIRSPETVRERFGAQDVLEWHLGVLVQVCNAVHFAHSRGVLHRDLKPGNVMVGAFGEVYVLDWGIAVSLRPQDKGRFPLAAESYEIAGTPGYMAPEMYVPDGSLLGERTDVYLLGAILWEILAADCPPAPARLDAGAPPVPPPPDGPEELREIVSRAMAPVPESRFESAQALRDAIQRFLRHRGSALVADAAAAELLALVTELARKGGDAAARRERAYRRYGQCRFGFNHALQTWPGNERARLGLARATRAMIEFELDEGSHEAAAGLLADLSPPDPGLAARIEAAQARAAAERRHVEVLRELGRDMDPKIAQRTRVNAGAVLCGLWSVGAFFGEHLDRIPHGYPSHHMPLFAVLLTLAVSLAIIWRTRSDMLRTAVNRWAASAVVFALAGSALLRIGAWVAGLPPRQTTLIDFVIWMCVTAILAIVMTRRLFFASAAHLAAFWVSAIWPEQLYVAMGFATGVLAVTVYFAWPRGSAGGPEGEPISRPPGALPG